MGREGGGDRQGPGEGEGGGGATLNFKPTGWLPRGTHKARNVAHAHYGSSLQTRQSTWGSQVVGWSQHSAGFPPKPKAKALGPQVGPGAGSTKAAEMQHIHKGTGAGVA